MVADISERPKPRRVSQELKERIHAEALVIGVRPAARKYGVNENTVCQWSCREKWKLPKCLPTLPYGKRQRDVSSVRALNALAGVIDEQSEHSRLYLSAATLQASHQLAQAAGHTEGERVPYAGLLNVSRSGDTVHGWTAQRQQPPVVAVQVNMPTPEERAKLDATDAMLDAITKRLTAPE